jgi:pimeloyl-ACP methyl ester carboxylesterase
MHHTPHQKTGGIPLALLAGMLVALSLCARAQEPSPTPRPLPSNVETFTIRTRSEQNKQVPFYLRIPTNYDAAGKERIHRLLFICPVVNADAETVIQGENGYQPLLDLADQRGWFVLSGTFKHDAGEVMDRRTSYYYPEAFSGRAVVEALDQVAKKYRVDPTRILMQGLSGGAQFVHRFAIWAPERVTAVAINSSSWFDPPNAKCNQVAWLVTIGESDTSFGNSLEFVEQLRVAGATPLFRSYVGMVHEGSTAATLMNLAFLKFYDEATRSELGKKRTAFTKPEELRALGPDQMAFVGDSQDWRYLPNTPENREEFAEDYRIYLPNKEIARLWGSEDGGE